MASSGKFDISSSSSPGRPLYTSAKRGSHTSASSMERSSSFRENMENPILSSLPSMSRSTINVSQADVNNFFQCLRFDLKSMAAEYKCNRYGDFKRLASAALCASDDLPSGLLKGKSSSPEDLKRFKVGLRESTIKARERVKVFSEVLSVINKCFPSIPSRKRSRPDSFSGDRSNVLLADRTTVGKMGAQSHALTSAFDYEQQKVEERGKNGVPNKRTRTSMVDQKADVRPNTPARSSGSVERPNSSALQGADRVLPVVADGWEKGKMKKKRSGIKADTSPSSSSVSTKPVDGSREPKQGMHPRGLPDARSRTNDPYEFSFKNVTIDVDDNADAFDVYEQYSDHIDAQMNLDAQENDFYPSLMREVGKDVPTSCQIGISGQLNKSTNVTMKPKTVQMKRNGRESAGSKLFKEYMAKQEEKQDRVIKILESDVSCATKDDPYSVARCMVVINGMVDGALMTNDSPLLYLAIDLIEDPVKREVFMNMRDDSARLKWLQHKQDRGN